MTWMYAQDTGCLYLNNALTAKGYSGHGEGVNNPSMQSVHNVGPLPCGSYTIGAPRDPIDHLGPIAMPLSPDPANEMFGRFAFFIHGDTPSMDQTASDGCIIMPHITRAAISESDDKSLIVVETYNV